MKEKGKSERKIKARSSGEVVILSEEVLVLTKEEVVLILEVDFMVIISDVVNRDIYILNVDPLKVGKVTKMLCFKEMMTLHQVDLRLEKI